MSIQVYSKAVTPDMIEKAEQLAAIIPFCDRGRSKVNGQGFYLVPGSKPGVRYYTSDLGCTCPGYRNRGVCSHQQACVIALQRQTAARIEAAQQKRRENGQCRSVGCILSAEKNALKLCTDHARVLRASVLEGWE